MHAWQQFEAALKTEAHGLRATALLSCGVLLLEQPPPPFVLRIDRVPNLEPGIAVHTDSALRHDAFQVALADESKKSMPRCST